MLDLVPVERHIGLTVNTSNTHVVDDVRDRLDVYGVTEIATL